MRRSQAIRPICVDGLRYDTSHPDGIFFLYNSRIKISNPSFHFSRLNTFRNSTQESRQRSKLRDDVSRPVPRSLVHVRIKGARSKLSHDGCEQLFNSEKVSVVDSWLAPCHCTACRLDEDRFGKARDRVDCRSVARDLVAAAVVAAADVAAAVAVESSYRRYLEPWWKQLAPG